MAVLCCSKVCTNGWTNITVEYWSECLSTSTGGNTENVCAVIPSSCRVIIDEVEKHLQINHSSACEVTHHGLHICRVYDTCVPNQLMGQHRHNWAFVTTFLTSVMRKVMSFWAALLLVTQQFTTTHISQRANVRMWNMNTWRPLWRRSHLTQHWEIGKIFFCNGIHKLMQCWTICIEKQGNYVVKWCTREL
jgi:hypothetical protein